MKSILNIIIVIFFKAALSQEGIIDHSSNTRDPNQSDRVLTEEVRNLQSWQNQIYTSLPLNYIDLKQVCSYGQMIDINPINNLKTGKNLFFANLLECGFGLFDASDPLKIKQIYSNKDTVPQKLSILEDGRLYVSNLQGFVLIYDIQQPEAPKQVEKIETKGSINGFYMYSEKNLLFFLSGKNTYIYFYQDSTLKFIQTITKSDVIGCILFYKSPSTQEEFLLIGEPYLQIYQVTDKNQNNSRLLELKEICLIVEQQVTSYVLVQKSYLYVQTFFAGIYLVNIEEIVTTLKQDCQKQKDSAKALFGDYQDIKGILVSGDKLIASVAIYGLYIFNINPVDGIFEIFQHILIEGICNGLAITNQQSNSDNLQELIIYSGEDNLLVFQRTNVNDYLEIPNLLNLHQATLNDEKKEPYTWAYHCIVDQSKGTLFTTSNENGMFAISPSSEFSSDQFLLKYHNSKNIELLPTWDAAEGLAIHPSSKYIFVGQGTAGLIIMDITDLDNVQNIVVTNFGFSNAELDAIKVSTDGNILIFAGGYQGFLIASIKDIKKPKLLASLFTENSKNVPCKNVAFGKNDKIAFATYRYYGVVAIDIGDAINKQDGQDTSSIKLEQLSFVITQGAEDLILTNDKNYIILSDAFRGITIIEVIDPRNMKVISNVKTEGWSLHLSFLDSQENYLVSNSREFGQLFLLDVSNKKYPRVIQKYKYLNQDSSQDICLSPNKKIGYMLSSSGIVLLSLRSNLIFHFDFFIVQNSQQIDLQLSNTSTQNQKSVDKYLTSSKSIQLHNLQQRGLQVGEEVIVKMAQIFPSSSMSAVRVSKAMSYYNYQLSSLPSWIFFNESDLTLQINVTKDSLTGNAIQNNIFANNKQDVQVAENWIALVIQEQVSSYDFIKESGEIIVLETQAQQIFDDCVDLNLISQNNFVNDEINDKVASSKLRQLNPTLYSSKAQTSSQSITLINFILSILKKKVTYYPIKFYTQSSLTVNIVDKTKPCISSVGQNTISIFFKVNAQQASFVDKKYSGVVVSLSQQQDNLKLEGQLDSINNVLSTGIKLHIWENIQSSDVAVEIEVQDGGLNNPVYKKFISVNSFIISINQPTLPSKNPTMQKQFNSIFDEGKITILEKFSFTFPESVFMDQDSPNLTYSIRIKEDSDDQAKNTNSQNKVELSKIPQGFWMTFSSNERTFQGTPSTANFLDSITVIITASDGYFRAEDEFTINVTKIPFAYVFYIAVQVLGPVLGILGMWRYKSVVYNSLKRQSTYLSPHTVVAGKGLQMQIPLLEYEIQTAQKIFTTFLETVDKQSLVLQITQAKQNYFNFQYALQYSPQQNESQNPDNDDTDIQQSPDMLVIQNNGANFALIPDLVLQFKEEIDKISPTKKRQSIFYRDDKNEVNQPVRSRALSEADTENQLASPEKSLIFDKLKKLQKVKKQQKSKVDKIMKKKQNDQLNIRFEDSPSIRSKKSSMAEKPDEILQQNDECKFFDSHGQLHTKYLITQMIEFLQSRNFQIKGVTQLQMENLRVQLSNETSSFVRIFSGLFSIYLSESDRLTSEIINFIRSYAISKHTLNDWYKEYVKIIPNFENIFLDVFPFLTLDSENLKLALEKLFTFTFSPLSPSNGNSNINANANQKNQNQAIGPEDALIPLIEQTLYAYTLGITFQPKTLITQPRGECLIIKPSKVRSVKVFIPSKTSTNKLCKCLASDENEMSLVENQKLPSWIKSVDVRNNTILIDGVPTEKDLGIYLMKIFDDQNFVIRSQIIKVISNPNQQRKQTLIKRQISTYSNVIDYDIPIEDNKQSDIFSALQFSRKAKDNKINTIIQSNSSTNFWQGYQNEPLNSDRNTALTSKNETQNNSLRFVLQSNRSEPNEQFIFQTTERNEQ